MKILLATRQFDGIMGGLERQITFLANQFVERGNEVCILYLSDGNGSPYFALDRRINLIRIGPISPQLKANAIQKIVRQFSIYKKIRANSPDVCISFMTGGFYLVRFSTFLLRIPCVLSERNSPAMYRLTSQNRWKTLAFFAMTTASAITVQFQSYIKGYPRILHRKISVIPNSSTLKVSRGKRADGKGAYNYVFAGRFSFQKQPICLIKAFSYFSKTHPEARLVLYGEGELGDEMRAEIVRTDSTSNISVRPAISNIEEILGEANVVCAPSLWEGFPNTVLESLSMGIPVIGFESCDGISDLITDGLNGWLAKGQTGVDSLVEALERSHADLLNDPVSAQIIRDSVAQYSPNVALELWDELMEKLLGK